MKFNSLQKFLFVVLCQYSFTSFGQTETLVTIEDESLIEDAMQQVGDNLMYTTYLYGNYSLWNLDLNSGSVSSLDSNFVGLGNHRFSDEGMFYFDYEYIGIGISGEYTLNFIEPSGNKTSLLTLLAESTAQPDHYKPKFPTMCNNRYYINGYSNNAHCIWESDGTIAGTQLIYQSQDPIIGIKERNDTLLIMAKNATDYLFSSYTFGSPAFNFASISTSALSSDFKLIGKSNNHLYFNAKDANNQWYVTRIDFQDPPDFFVAGPADSVVFEPNRFFLHQTTYADQYQLVKGDLLNPTQLDTIQFVHSLQTSSTALDQYFGDGYHRIQSIEHGMEMVYLNSDDSLEIIQTTVKGAGSSIPLNVNGYVYNHFFGHDNFLTADDGKIYTILTNGNDSHYYLYRFDGLSEQSLFKLENPEDIGNFFIHNDFIYWFEFGNETRSIKRRSLLSSIELQPLQQTTKETWFRQLATGTGSTIYSQYYTDNQLYLQGIKLDSEGNSIVNFTVGDYITYTQLISSDTNALFRPKGSNVFAKYDEFGALKWLNGIGRLNGFLLRTNQFAVRENGNILTIGQYFGTGYFDNDSLNSPHAGTYLAELDANTGEVLWKKRVTEKYYLNDFEPEGIVIDEQDNIYIAVNYKGYGVWLDGIYLSSDKSIVNALVKYSPEGDLIWAENCETPWLNYFGATRTLSYSETQKTLMLSQSQGYYSILSSCEFQDWGYFIQEWDTDGNQLNTFELKGSDIGSMPVGTMTSDNRFFGMGYFRGKLAIDNYDIESPLGNGCHTNEGFSILYDRDLNNIVSAKTTSNRPFYPLDISTDGHFIYVLGVDVSEELVILKHTSEGHFIGYKRFNQFIDPFYQWAWNRSYYFDITDDFIVIQGENFRRDPTYEVAPLINSIMSVSVLKTTNSGWINDDSWMQSAPVVYDEVSEILIYPNPFSDHVNVLFPGTEVGFNSYQIVDINGRLVSEGALTDIQFQTITLPEMRQGVYLITFMGNDEKLTKQLMKF